MIFEEASLILILLLLANISDYIYEIINLLLSLYWVCLARREITLKSTYC